MQVHIVKKGDTLWKISREYGVSFDEVKKINAHLANPEYIVPGMKIFIPDTKKANTSMTHPYTDGRQVKKDMEAAPYSGTVPAKAKQMTTPAIPQKAQPAPAPTPKAQPAPAMTPPKAQPVKEQPKAQPIQPVPVPMPVPTPAPQPIHFHHQPVYNAPPVQPVQPFIIPFHLMPKPEVEKMPSPEGWQLVESTSIDIQVNIEENYTYNVQPPMEEKKVVEQPKVSPVVDEPSSAIYHSYYESCDQPTYIQPMYQGPMNYCGPCGNPGPMYMEPVYNQPYIQPMHSYQPHHGCNCGCHHPYYQPMQPFAPFPYQAY